MPSSDAVRSGEELTDSVIAIDGRYIEENSSQHRPAEQARLPKPDVIDEGERRHDGRHDVQQEALRRGTDKKASRV